MVTNPPASFVEFRKEEIEQSIPSRFRQQALRFPGNTAIHARNQRITYADLDRLSNKVVQAVLAKWGAKQEPVALLFEPGISMVAAILGVLKAGRFILPLDPTSPASRNAAILEGSRATHVLADTKDRAAAISLAGDDSLVIDVDDLDPDIPDASPNISVAASDPAYVLYTSGSTGRPKGVLHNHRNVLHAIHQHTNSLRIHSGDRVSLLASYGRIAGMTSIWRALLNGATLCVFNLLVEGWGELLRWLIAEEITIYQSVPTLFRHWAQVLTEAHRFPKLRIIHLGGEPVTVRELALFKKHFEADCQLLHNLGSTELSTYRQYFISMDTPVAGTVVPVGFPVEDKEVMLLDESGREVGFNEIGEIVVRSPYLAVEYWQDPDLTRATFLPDPQGGGKRVFHTGDLGRMRPDGCLEHLGRKDRQVKIRGIRVEPAEIEAILGQHPSLRQAVVTARVDERGNNQLIAYVVPMPGITPSSAVLRGCLRELLPEHMVPAAFVTLGELPLTAGGKVDHRALPPPGPIIPQSEALFVAPRTAVEKTVAAIWEEVLGAPGVGLNDRFLDLGGNSLKAIQIITRLQDALGGVLPLEPLFSTATVAQQAAAVERHLAAAALDEGESAFLAELETMSEEEAERRLAAPGPAGAGTQRKTSQWQTSGMTRAFLEVRAAFPGADLQLEVMLKLIRAWRPEPKTAIDLGCGDGFLGRILLERFPGCRVCFVDFSEPMLEAAREKTGGSGRATIVKADFTDPKWAAQLGGLRNFDLVVSGLAIHHQPDAGKKRLYAAIHDLLASGGVFLNLEQVASTTKANEDVYHDYLIDHLHAFHSRTNPDKPRHEVAEGYLSSPARKENILAPVDDQCAWLREIGFQDVDCFFKVFEHALFGGRKTAQAVKM